MSCHRGPRQTHRHVDEMAGAAVFLASDLASYVTGHAASGWYRHPYDGHWVLGPHT